MEIIPAIIPKNKQDFLDHVEKVHHFTQTVQIDVCDGKFVPSVSWPYTSMVGAGNHTPAHTRSEKSMDDDASDLIESGMPYWDTLDYEAHLMVENPAQEIERWILLGAKRIIVHAETIGDMEEFFETITKEHGYTSPEYFDFFELGIAFNIDTPIVIPEDRFHFVQLMGVDHIGVQGQPFDEKVLEKIRDVRTRFPNMPISVDGGVTLENAKELVDAGADRLVIGSAIFKSAHPGEAIDSFKHILKI
jgi:ribulose-phosphate 3-epimerase